MSVPYTFATATSSIPLSQLDSNFATAITLGGTNLYLGNTTTTVTGLTLTGSTFTGNVTTSNAVITGGSIDGTTVGATTASTGAFTTLSASSTVSGTGFSTYLASPPAIGGTTAAAGSFTTLSASSTTTLSGGTANGVAYLNGSKVLTTGSALTFDGTNLGLSNSATATVVKIDGSGRYKQFETYSSGTRQFYMGWDNTSQVANITNDNNYPILFNITGSEQMRLTSTGLGIGYSTMYGKLNVNSMAAPASSGNMNSGLVIGNGSSGTGINIGTYDSGTTATSYGWISAAYVTNAGITNSLVLQPNGGNLGLGVTPSASAIFDAQSTTKGVRFPNMTTTQKNAISSPAAGLVVFDTTLSKLCVYSGSAWQTITSI